MKYMNCTESGYKGVKIWVNVLHTQIRDVKMYHVKNANTGRIKNKKYEKENKRENSILEV